MNRAEEQQLDLEDILGTMSTAAPPPAVVPAGEEMAATAPASTEATAGRSRRNPSLYANVPAPDIIDSLPLETRLMVRRRQYGGFWQAEFLLKGLAAAGACFQPETSDIFLASLPKSGTTWLKALAFATLNRATHSPSDGQHPLNHRNPHDCVGFLEFMIIQQQDDAGVRGLYEALPSSPRLFATHLPYSQLPHAITAEGSRCRIVYVCRDPKDVLISYWNFYKKVAATVPATAAGGDGQADQDSAGLIKFEEVFELFCEGRFPGGPHWLHALEYWHASQKRPNHVLFLRYEDMLGDPVGNLKKLAAFMGCAFSEEDEEVGVVDQIVELCSLENLKSKDVNKNGRTTRLGIKSETFFRKGQVGDWKNYMTMDMAARLDKIVEEATRGSGLTFGGDSSLLHIGSYIDGTVIDLESKSRDYSSIIEK